MAGRSVQYLLCVQATDSAHSRDYLRGKLRDGDVGWAKRSVPTIAGGMLDGGHVAALLCPPYDRVPQIPGGGRPHRLRNNHAGPAASEHCVGPALPVGLAQPTTTIILEKTPMARLKFGAFLAPHHPIGEHPMLQFRRDLDF